MYSRNKSMRTSTRSPWRGAPPPENNFMYDHRLMLHALNPRSCLNIQSHRRGDFVLEGVEVDPGYEETPVEWEYEERLDNEGNCWKAVVNVMERKRFCGKGYKHEFPELLDLEEYAAKVYPKVMSSPIATVKEWIPWIVSLIIDKEWMLTKNNIDIALREEKTMELRISRAIKHIRKQKLEHKAQLTKNN